MPKFVDPTAALRGSFLEAIAEVADDEYPLPWFVADVDPDAWTDRAAFVRYVDRLARERNEEHAKTTGFVPMATLWWVDGTQFIGRLAVRHRLNPRLTTNGGHIGYDVRPACRNRGHAKAMLAAALPIACGLGITEALLTCDNTNIASRRVIESSGGRLLDVVGAKRRYLLHTTAEGG